MELIQSSWKPGASFTKGLSADEYFYDQIFQAVKKNVKDKTLPFFNPLSDSIPFELTTGKQITDLNLVALEQCAAKNGYESNIWIYASEVENLSKQGYKINLKKNSESVLCITKYENPTHLNSELYINEGGNKQKLQFLYNFDCFDERTQKILIKHYSQSSNHRTNIVTESFKNYIENTLKVRNHNCPELEKLKENLRHQCQNLSPNLAPVISAQAKHICVEATGKKELRQLNLATQENCYKALSNFLIEEENKKTPSWKVGEILTKAIDSGTWYAKSYTSKNFNPETKKLREEEIHIQENLKQFKTLNYER